jgi:aryl-alcohol dehydrogenase-like predicted oxidoreductase
MTVRLISSCNRTDAAISRLYNRENQTDEAIGNAVEEMAAAREVSMAVVATAWSLRKGVDPIVGLNSKEYIAEAVAAAKLVLTEDAVKLEKAYQAR